MTKEELLEWCRLSELVHAAIFADLQLRHQGREVGDLYVIWDGGWAIAGYDVYEDGHHEREYTMDELVS